MLRVKLYSESKLELTCVRCACVVMWLMLISKIVTPPFILFRSDLNN